MAAQLGPRAVALAMLLVATVGSPAIADDDTTTSTTTTTTTVIDTTVPTTTTTTTTTTPTNTAPTNTAPTNTAQGPNIDAPAGVGQAVAAPIGEIPGPATAGSETPERGTQVQLQPPPPPPPTLPAGSELPANSGQGRRAVYSKSLQRVWAVDADGTVLLTARVSGRLDPTDPSPGTYSVYSRSLHTFAVHNPSITWNYMVRFAHGGTGGNIGFHEIPYQYGRPVQTNEQLGQALSGGCVRMASADAIWMWNWAGVGTTVVVLG
jgi:lipoprotein-anchoring transpeptidase ErfK/SrfK